MAFQPSLTRVTQKRGAKQPDKVDVGETTIPGGLSLREMDDAPTQGAEDRARPSLSETGIAPEMHSGGARPKFLPVRFHETVQGRSPDSDREPRPRLDETNPWRHASILLHTSPSSRFTRFPHQPADSPSSAIEPHSLEKRMARGVARERHGSSGTRSGVPSGESLFQLPQVGRFQTDEANGVESPSTLGACGFMGRQGEAFSSGLGLRDPDPFLEHNTVVSSVMASRVTELPQMKMRGNVGDARSTDPRFDEYGGATGRFGNRVEDGNNNGFLKDYHNDCESTRIYSPPIVSTGAFGMGILPVDLQSIVHTVEHVIAYEGQANRVFSVADSVQMRRGRVSSAPWFGPVDDPRQPAFPLRSAHSEDGFLAVDALRPWDRMPPSTAHASYQPWPPRVTLATFFSQGHPSQPLRTFYPGVGFLPVDALRPWDRGPPPTAPESWQALPPENAPIPSVTSVRASTRKAHPSTSLLE